MELIEQHMSFGGWQKVFHHYSKTLDCTMNFSIYLPPQVEVTKAPVLYWLSGLTCNEQNFITKSGAQQYAAEHGIIIVSPDTSPRGENIPDNNAYDLGQGASFYLNATQEPWVKHYQMYNYVLKELPLLISNHFPALDKKAICGHSMGGHGALILALKNPDQYTSVSAFAPIVSPSEVAWGQKTFEAYLGKDQTIWEQYDATKLVLSGHQLPEIFIDQGLDDPFYETELLTNQLEAACNTMNIKTIFRYHKGYDHSYYFISSFIKDHIAYHAKKINQNIS